MGNSAALSLRHRRKKCLALLIPVPSSLLGSSSSFPAPTCTSIVRKEGREVGKVVTPEDVLHFDAEVLEVGRGGGVVGDGIGGDPLPAGELVEVVAGVHGAVHGAQDRRRCSPPPPLPCPPMRTRGEWGNR